MEFLAPPAPIQQTDEDDELVMQNVVRVRETDGVERVRGTLVADFACEQRHATLHVGFCPPLESAPAVEVELVDGPDAAVKVTQAFAHGAAFELRLVEPAEDACRVTLEFSAAPKASV